MVGDRRLQERREQGAEQAGDGRDHALVGQDRLARRRQRVTHGDQRLAGEKIGRQAVDGRLDVGRRRGDLVRSEGGGDGRGGGKQAGRKRTARGGRGGGRGAGLGHRDFLCVTGERPERGHSHTLGAGSSGSVIADYGPCTGFLMGVVSDTVDKCEVMSLRKYDAAFRCGKREACECRQFATLKLTPRPALRR